MWFALNMVLNIFSLGRIYACGTQGRTGPLPVGSTLEKVTLNKATHSMVTVGKVRL